MNEFVHLHVHTEYSLLDGACRIDRLIAYAKKLGQKAITITDHGNMYGVVDFYKACKEGGIKPIIGCEVYVAPRTRFDKTSKLDIKPYHMVLLCKNQTGYQNLLKLVSAGYIEGFYNRPRIDKDLLKKHSKGLIGLSACLAGEIPRLLLSGDYDTAKEKALEYSGIFEKDSYYLEIQNHGLTEQKHILPMMAKLSEETGIPLAATNDAHYIEKQDAKMQNVLICIQTNKVVGEENAMAFSTNEFYIKSYDEMNSLFSAFPEAVENTNKIAQMCNVEFEFGVTKLPEFKTPNEEDNINYFVNLCRKGLINRYGKTPARSVKERLDYELDIIIKMGYVDYFLIVHDFIAYARSKDIPVGPGRGSGAGSIAAYCIGITGVDPIKYNLIFERFLNPERISMPDFDIDFCYERRHEVIEYVNQKYGEDHVSQIVTFGTMAAKGSIRDVGRALGMPYQTVDSIAKLVPFQLNMTIEKALKMSSPLRQQYQTDPKVQELLDTARKIEGMPRHASTHAAGVVITKAPTVEYVPLATNDGVIVAQFSMTKLEELGLLKMDFLGLRNLTIVKDTETSIRKRNPDFSVDAISLEDKSVFDMMSQGNSEGVFQFEGSGIKQVLVQLKPDCLEDLIALTSLYRPGPMESIPTYVRNRHHPEMVEYKHPMLKPILEVTYGCIVYQEQVMEIFRKLAGYSYGRADLVRRAMSKKKKDIMEQERKYFIHGKINDDGSIECAGAVKNGVSEKIASEIFDEMSSFASYAFNKSHAVAYAYLAYQTAYLKCHYPKEYMAALLTSITGNTDKIIEYIEVCKKNGIQILPPDINESMKGFTVTGDGIRFGLGAIKNVGNAFIENVTNERKNGKFESLYDLCKRMNGRDLNKRTLESLIKSGACDSFENNRREMASAYETILSTIESNKRNNIDGQMNLFSTGEEKADTYVIPKMEDYTLSEKLEMEKNISGLYISGHPLDAYENLTVKNRFDQIKELLRNEETQRYKDKQTITAFGIIQNIKIINTKNSAQMAFLSLEDRTGIIEVVIFPNIFENISSFLNVGDIAVVTGDLSYKEDEAAKILCQSIRNIKEYKQNSLPQILYFRLSSRNTHIFQQVAQIVYQNKGNTPVRFYFEDRRKICIIKNLETIQLRPSIIDQLQQIAGNEKVVVKQKENH